ncbi:hypothetical protein C8J56DRAFT_761210, partial [Mycena floridula]
LSPRIQHLVASNERPLDVELSQFRDLILAEEATVLDLDRDIAETRQRLASLIATKAESQRSLDQYQRIIHPIRRIPAEVLGQVFL